MKTDAKTAELAAFYDTSFDSKTDCLTAAALVFAIFQLNPAPFCLLDEVDAPLDDANTERYAKLVKSMSAGTPFLFISHNKIAMEMAEQLIGVTMQEQGVSRIVAVDMEAAFSLAQQAA